MKSNKVYCNEYSRTSVSELVIMMANTGALRLGITLYPPILMRRTRFVGAKTVVYKQNVPDNGSTISKS